jgi:hypothetical protein
LANEVRIRASVRDDATRPINNIRDAWTKFQREGSQGVKAGLTAAAATKGFDLLGQAIHGVTDFMGRSIQRASDLAESQGKVSVVFGESADEIEAWASRSARAFGQSSQQALEAAGTYGNLFQAFGLGQDEAAKMSTALVELAADLASFNNTSVDDALLALRSGLSGETEPLKRYGIAISDARLRTTLMAQGVKDLGSTLTPLQKSMAAYTLIMQDSSLAQGDFARTADGAANSARILDAEIADLEAEIGTKALPAQRAWLQAQRDGIGVVSAVVTGLDAQANSVSENADALETLIDQFAPWASGLADATQAHVYLSDEMAGARAEAQQMAFATEHAGDMAETAAPKVGDLADETKDLEKAARDAEREIDDLSDTIADELFGEAITAGNEARLKETIKDLRDQRSEVKKSSPEWKILTGEIAENRQRLFELHLEQAAEEGPEAAIDFLRKQAAASGLARDEIAKLIRKYQQLAGVQTVLSPTQLFGGKARNLTGFAHGGRYRANEPRIVGEEGPEIDIPDHSGVIVPGGGTGGGSMSGGGSPVVIPVPVPSFFTPAMASVWVNEAGPVMVDYFRRRGLV